MPVEHIVKQYGHSKNFSVGGTAGGGGKSTISLLGFQADGTYSETVTVDMASGKTI